MLTLINRSFVVHASQEAAWNHLARVTEWHTWVKHIREVELLPNTQLQAGSSGVIHLRNGIRTTFKMVEFNPYDNWKWVGPFLWLTIHYDHLFRRVDDQHTEITFIVAAEGAGAAIFGRIFAMVYNRNLNIAIPNLIDKIYNLSN